MQVFVTGATGLLGAAVARALVDAGHAVTALSRSASPRLPPGVRAVQGDPTRAGAWQDALRGCDACVHLAGEPIAAARWNDARKRAIRESRVESTRRVAELISAGGPSVLVSSSAIGYYGPHGDEVLDEEAPPGTDFLARVCVDWEAAAMPTASRARVMLLRTGIVLAREGGALAQMLLPFRYFVGGPIGKGDFWQSWIHVADVAQLIVWALAEVRAAGPVNATAPNPVLNRQLASAIGRTLHRPSAIAVPAAALRVALGELATIVATGQRVVPRKALDAAYQFRFPEVDGALRDLLGR